MLITSISLLLPLLASTYAHPSAVPGGNHTFVTRGGKAYASCPANTNAFTNYVYLENGKWQTLTGCCNKGMQGIVNEVNSLTHTLMCYKSTQTIQCAQCPTDMERLVEGQKCINGGTICNKLDRACCFGGEQRPGTKAPGM